MTAVTPSLPVVRELPEGFSLVDAFHRINTLPGCLWLDSACRGPRDKDSREVGRYSFLTADPIKSLVASVSDLNPWPTLDQWCRELPSDCDPSLPPFQGGIAGLIGYEAATWLEPVGMALEDDLPTPAISIGLYDWTIATDHETGRSWIISQGLGAASPQERYERASRRADQVLKRLSSPPPPSDSPVAANHPGRLDERVSGQHPTARCDLHSNLSGEQFRSRVDEIVHAIRDGDSFQVNLAQRLLRRADEGSGDLYLRLRVHNPAPFGAYFSGQDFEVLSSSPEGFLRLRDGEVETRPIKGTVPRTGDRREDERLAAQLELSQKDRAENVMIVDLMRNDLSRVCTDESVRVKQLCKIERYQYVQHLVSIVEGRIGDDHSVVDLLRACFPGGSVTGAPKIEAMRTIARLEPNPRGPYCGSIGYIGCGGNSEFNILIRTITAAHGYWQIPVGGGITARSDAQAEENETWVKAEGMLRAIAGP